MDFYDQQGDVLIKEKKIGNLRLKKLYGDVLKEGEATGHAHRLDPEIEKKYTRYEDDYGDRYLKVVELITLKHEEHKPIEIDKGFYKIDTVREYDHFDEEVREVQD